MRDNFSTIMMSHTADVKRTRRRVGYYDFKIYNNTDFGTKKTLFTVFGNYDVRNW